MTKLLTVKEVKETLQVSQDMAYKIVNTDGFPSIKIIGIHNLVLK